jgi:4'-phosphopantetheinyl transferase
MSAPHPIAAGDVQLWHARVPPQDDPALASRHMALLTPEERAQHTRFMFEKDRRRYLLTRALVRTVLSRYAPVAPEDWRFQANAHGRPAIANDDALARRLCFNLSHTDALVVLAVTAGREIGIDVESTQRHAPLEVADRFFSPQESAALRRLPAGDQPARFWELWTFKESYIKARGMGLAIPLDRFSFALDAPGDLSIAFEPGFDDTPARWQFRQFRLHGEFLVGVCAGTSPPGDLHFSATEVVPLHADTPSACVFTRRSGGLA